MIPFISTYTCINIKLHAPAVMLNVLGQHVEAAEKYVTENPSAHLHMYGKIEAKHNRKMGHVTLFSDVPDEVEEFGKGIDFNVYKYKMY